MLSRIIWLWKQEEKSRKLFILVSQEGRKQKNDNQRERRRIDIYTKEKGERRDGEWERRSLGRAHCGAICRRDGLNRTVHVEEWPHGPCLAYIQLASGHHFMSTARRKWRIEKVPRPFGHVVLGSGNGVGGGGGLRRNSAWFLAWSSGGCVVSPVICGY